MALAETFKAFLLGMVLSFAVGAPLGLLMGVFKTVDNIFDPVISALYVMPVLPLIPLLMIWFGLGWQVKGIYVFLFSFIVLSVNVYTGVKYVEGKYLEVGRIFGATRMQSFLKIVLPGALPMTMAGVRLCLGRGIKGMILAEMVMLASGLGYIIINASAALKVDVVLAVILVTLALGIFMSWISKFLHKKIAPWSEVE